MIPQSMPEQGKRLKWPQMRGMDNIDDIMIPYRMKSEWNKKGMYAFVCWDWVIPFVKWINGRKVLEVMAGAGWLAHALREKGVPVIATDNMSWGKKIGWDLKTEVIEMDAIESVLKYGKNVDIVIISWPYMDDTAFRCLQAINTVNPDALLVYIGEREGGCTASYEFFEHFSIIDNDSLFEEADEQYCAWDGLHDSLWLGKPKF